MSKTYNKGGVVDGVRADYTFIDDIVGKPLPQKPNDEYIEKLLEPLRESYKDFEFTLGKPTVFKLDDIEYPSRFVNIKIKK